MLIYTPDISSRIKYVFKLIFKDELGVDYEITTDKKKFTLHQNEKINYSDKRICDEFFIKSSTLLFENFIAKKNILVEEKSDLIILFPNNDSCDLGFDIFSSVFYMVSRYEEYLPNVPDEFGRFPAESSLANQNNFLQYPVVNHWINFFKEKLHQKFSLLAFKPVKFTAVVTYDIDVAYQYKGKNFVKNIGAAIKDVSKFRFKNIFKRIPVIKNKQKDPWDVYDFLKHTITENKLDSIFFFLLGDRSRYDKNLSHKSTLMKQLINKVSGFSKIGIHPSYNSSVVPEKILIEKERLEKILNKKIVKSRQHYLKFTLPQTYNYLIDAGITEDYSMCFADLPGFRAGTCKPFFFYDLKNEKETSLKIFPVTLMEGTFIKYMKLSPDEGLKNILDLLEQVKNVNGTFISIWHNHTVSETEMYKDWREVHNKMIEKIMLHLRN